MSNSFMQLGTPIPVGDFVVVGYDPVIQEAVVDRGYGPKTVGKHQRAAMDVGYDAFTSDQLAAIEEAIIPLKLQANERTHQIPRS